MTDFAAGDTVEIPPHTLTVGRELFSNADATGYVASTDEDEGVLLVEHDPEPERFGYDVLEWHPRRASVRDDN